MPAPFEVTLSAESDSSHLVATRWTYLEYLAGVARDHTVQVVEVRDGRAHVVTLYSEPFRHWWIPITAMLSEYSALFYLGDEDTMEWIRHGATIIDRSDLSLWVIHRLTNASAALTVFESYGNWANGDTGDRSVPLGALVASFRLATTEEVSDSDRRSREPFREDDLQGGITIFGAGERLDDPPGFPDDALTPLSDDDLDRVHHGFAMMDSTYRPPPEEVRRALFELYRIRGLQNEEQKANEGEVPIPRSSFSHLVDD